MFCTLVCIPCKFYEQRPVIQLGEEIRWPAKGLQTIPRKSQQKRRVKTVACFARGSFFENRLPAMRQLLQKLFTKV